ncbi:MAG: APC family permease [Nitrospinae bacterium]|nr:APC family permease [Nitrospinota bacterium]
MPLKLKHFLLGSPLPTYRVTQERLSKVLGLAVFSSDALSSVAYATEEILLILITAGSAVLYLSWPISLAIVTLLITVVTSYYQTVHAYPSGGGAYIVAKENLGMHAGLVAGAALMIDYVLTVAVSVAAGVAAITSAFPALFAHRVILCLLCILIVTLVNLRGVRESGRIFAVPTYAFIGSFVLMIVLGLLEYLLHQPPVFSAGPSTQPVETLTWFLVLRAFASGCAALTGVEAISNGVQAFKPPEAKNASATLCWMAIILGSFFVGITFLANHYGVLPREEETVVSQLARLVFGGGAFYYLIQVTTALILILAANTSYADFPRLASLLARDRFLPRQMANLGDRLVFSNGIIMLGVLAALLIVIFSGSTHALIPLYAVGVFLSFTLSQTGMVRHWLRGRAKAWRKGIVINSIGALATAVVLIIIATTKFTHGAWVVLMVLPAFVLLFKRVQHHYRLVGVQISLRGFKPTQALSRHTVVVPISGLSRQVVLALQYARLLSRDVRAVYVNQDTEATANLRTQWEKWGHGMPLIVLDSPYRSIVQPLLHYIEQVHDEHPDQIVTVILPEFIPAKWWQQFLHNQTALQIKGALLFKRGVVVTSVPYHLRR